MNKNPFLVFPDVYHRNQEQLERKNIFLDQVLLDTRLLMNEMMDFKHSSKTFMEKHKWTEEAIALIRMYQNISKISGGIIETSDVESLYRKVRKVISFDNIFKVRFENKKWTDI